MGGDQGCNRIGSKSGCLGSGGDACGRDTGDFHVGGCRKQHAKWFGDRRPQPGIAAGDEMAEPCGHHQCLVQVDELGSGVDRVNAPIDGAEHGILGRELILRRQGIGASGSGRVELECCRRRLCRGAPDQRLENTPDVRHGRADRCEAAADAGFEIDEGGMEMVGRAGDCRAVLVGGGEGREQENEIVGGDGVPIRVTGEEREGIVRELALPCQARGGPVGSAGTHLEYPRREDMCGELREQPAPCARRLGRP